jgi:hypothetical protein
MSKTLGNGLTIANVPMSKTLGNEISIANVSVSKTLGNGNIYIYFF